MTGHTCTLERRNTQSWEAHCACGWVSPRVSDRRTADQAHQAHTRSTRDTR